MPASTLPPPSSVSLPLTHTILHVTLSDHTGFRNTANVLLLWSPFPRCPNATPHLPGSLLQSPSSPKALWISLLPSDLWHTSSGPISPLAPSCEPQRSVCKLLRPRPSLLRAPHGPDQSWRRSQLTLSSGTVEWQNVTDISTLASLPPTQRCLGGIYMNPRKQLSVLCTWAFLCSPYLTATSVSPWGRHSCCSWPVFIATWRIRGFAVFFCTTENKHSPPSPAHTHTPEVILPFCLSWAKNS